MWIIFFPSGKMIYDICRLVVICVALYLIYVFLTGPTLYLLKTQYWFLGVLIGLLLVGLVLSIFFIPNGWRRWPALATVAAFIGAWGVMIPIKSSIDTAALEKGTQIVAFLNGRDQFSGISRAGFLHDIMPEDVGNVMRYLTIDKSSAPESGIPGDDHIYPYRTDGDASRLAEHGTIYYKLGLTKRRDDTRIDLNDVDVSAFFDTNWPMVHQCTNALDRPDACRSTEAMEARFGVPVRNRMNAFLAETGQSCSDIPDCRRLVSLTGERFGDKNPPRADANDILYRYCRETPFRADELACDCMTAELRSVMTPQGVQTLERFYTRELAAQPEGALRFEALDRSSEIKELEKAWPTVMKTCGFN